MFAIFLSRKTNNIPENDSEQMDVALNEDPPCKVRRLFLLFQGI